MALKVAADILLNTLNVLPDIDVSVLIPSYDEVAEVSESDRHHSGADRLSDQRELADPGTPEALGNILGLVLQKEGHWIKNQELSLVSVDHDFCAVFRKVE